MIPCQTCTVVDRNTGATLTSGIRYPLNYGGTAEILRILTPSGFFGGNKAKVLIRIDAPGQFGDHQWLPAVFDPASRRVYVSFPVLNMESILQYLYSQEWYYPYYYWYYPYYHGRRRRRHGGRRAGGIRYGDRGGRRDRGGSGGGRGGSGGGRGGSGGGRGGSGGGGR